MNMLKEDAKEGALMTATAATLTTVAAVTLTLGGACPSDEQEAFPHFWRVSSATLHHPDSQSAGLGGVTGTIPVSDEARLMSEFRRLDAASDEDFARFERDLDKQA